MVVERNSRGMVIILSCGESEVLQEKGVFEVNVGCLDSSEAFARGERGGCAGCIASKMMN